jgi:hypothetical protein
LPAGRLPFIDEHAVEVAATRERAWDALREVLERSFRGRRTELFARLLGASQTQPRGDPGETGASIVGFRVARAQAPTELDLEGEHRFSRYALTFRLDALADQRSRIRAETRAEFPGLHGRAYRAAVIGTRAHVVLVRRLLHAIRAMAERPPGGRSVTD